MKNYFSGRIFWEGIRELKTFWIACAAISAFVTFMNVVNASRDQADWDLCSPVMVMGFIVMPVAVLILCHRIYKRDSGSFYLEIISNRKAFLLSLAASAFVMAIAIMAVSVIVGILTIGISSLKLSMFFLKELFQWFLRSAATAVFWIGIILLALSLSASFSENIMIALVLLVFPKYLYFVVETAVSETIGLFPFSYSDSFFNGRWNLVTSWLNPYLFEYYDASQRLIGELVYTAGIGIVMLIGAVVLSGRKEGEEKSLKTPNITAHKVFQIMAAYMATMPACVVFYQAVLGDYVLIFEEITMIVKWYLLCVLVYYLYEWIAVGKWKKVKKSGKGLIWIPLLNLLLIGMIFGRRTFLLSWQPHNSSYVRILGSDLQDLIFSKDYFEYYVSNRKITDAETIGVLENCFAQDASAVRGAEGNSALLGMAKSCLVEFCNDGNIMRRRIYLNEQETEYLDKVIRGELKIEALQELANLEIKAVYFDNVRKSGENIETVMELLNEYIAEVPEKPQVYAGDLWKWSASAYSNEGVFQKIQVSVEFGGHSRTADLPLYFSMDCLDTYIKMHNLTVLSVRSEAEIAKKNGGVLQLNIYRMRYDENGAITGYKRAEWIEWDLRPKYLIDESKLEEAIEYLESTEDGNLFDNKLFLGIGDGPARYDRYYPLSDEGYELIYELYKASWWDKPLGEQ